uniref:Uncharacterized protein n=1 Tax=Anguilla anguilla TaxID=7936 RepID=A0A0E9TTF1_ANGAN
MISSTACPQSRTTEYLTSNLQ